MDLKNTDKKDAREIPSRLLLAIASVFCLAGCASDHIFSIERLLPVKKIQTTEELLNVLRIGFFSDQLASARFYKEKIGYSFANLTKNTNDLEEFDGENGEAVKMDEGNFKGTIIGVKKWTLGDGSRILNINFTTPGCLKQWEVEQIFMEVFVDVPDSVVFGQRPLNWPSTSKISQDLGWKKQIIFFEIGGHDGCLLNVVATEVYK